MNGLKEISTTLVGTYEYYDRSVRYIVEIYKEDEDTCPCWGCWLFRADYGTKLYMFGLPCERTDYNQALDIVVGNIEDQIGYYREEVHG